MLVYVIPVLIAAFSVQMWFEPGTVIAGGDFIPPVPSGRAYLSHWNQVDAGVGTPSFGIVMLPYAEFLRGAQTVGLDPESSQRIWLTLLMAGSAAAVVFFASGLSLPPIAAGAAGLLATFNAYRMIVSFDSVPVAALILAGLLGGLVLRAGLRRDSRSNVVAFALVSSGVGFVFLNPPHVVLVAVWIVVSVLLAWAWGGHASLRAALLFLLRASPMVLLANCWWLVPAGQTLMNPSFSERFAAPGPFAWAWTHRRASLLNALALNTTWAWNEPMYFPYAARLEGFPFAPLRFAFPLLALLGLLLAKGRERLVGIILLIIGAMALLLAKGLHPPFAVINRSFYSHVPGSWLFRDPFKVLLLLMLVFAVLGGIGTAKLLAVRGRCRVLARTGCIALTIGAMIYAFPLFTGDVVPDARPVLPPSHVRVPNAWAAAAGLLGSLPAEGKVLVLPTADFYGLPTTWGYYGVPFTRWAIHRPVLEPLPGGGFNFPGIGEQLISSIERDLRDSRSLEATTKLHALGVRYVLLRRDLDTSFEGRRLVNPDRLAQGLSHVPGISLMRSFRLLDIYALSEEAGSEVFPAVPVASGGQPHLIPGVMSLLPQEASVTMPERLPADQPAFIWSPGGTTEILRIGDQALWKLEAHATSTGFSLTATDPIRARVGLSRIAGLPARTLRFPDVTPPVVVTVKSQSFLFKGGNSPVDLGFATLPEKADVGLWEATGVSQIDLRSVGSVGNCDRDDDQTREELGLSASTTEQEGIPTLRLSARDHSACVAFPVRPFDPAARYRVQFDYKGVTGLPPRVCLWQDVVERCASLPALDLSPGWHHFDATTALLPRAGALELFFYADGDGDSTTTTEFRDVLVRVDERLDLFLIQESRPVRLPQLRYEKLGPAEFRVSVRDAQDPYLLVLTESYAPGWQVYMESGDLDVPQLRVNGYSNGWLLDRTGSYELRLAYEPERPARIARWISLISLCILGAYGLAVRRRHPTRVAEDERPEVVRPRSWLQRSHTTTHDGSGTEGV